MGYWAHIYTLIAFYFVLGASLGFFSSRTGYVSLLHAGFMGLGAYVNAIGLVQLGWPPLIGCFAGAGLAGVLAYAVSAPLFRAQGDYFAILTLTLQLAVTIFLINASGVTNGPLGISGIPPGPFASGAVGDIIVMTIVCIVVMGLFWFFGKSLWGAALEGLRNDDFVMASLGYEAPALKASAFAFSATCCAFMGGLYAQYISYIDPTAFQLEDSILILTVMVLAGRYGLIGVFISSLFVVGVPEALRFLPIESSASGNIREIAYGVALVSIILLREGARPRANFLRPALG